MKDKRINLGKTNIYRIFWTYAIPSVLMMIVQSTAGFIDSIFIGRYVGPDGLAAITLVLPVVMILIGVATMVAVGGTTLAGIEKGAGNTERSNNFFNVTSSLLFILGVVGALVIILVIPYAARVTGATGIVLENTITYARNISLFIPFFLLSFAFGFFLKLDGKPVLVVIIMLSGTLMNIFLDYLLITRFGLGIQGAAIATGASQMLPAMIMLFVIIYKSGWTFKKPEYHWKEISRLIFNGSSEFLSNIAFSVTGIIFNVIIMRRIGSDGVAAYAVALQLAGIVGSISYGIAEANQAAVSFNYGAKKFERVSDLRNLSLKVSFVLGIVLLVVANLFGDQLAGIFVSEASTVLLATNILGYYSIAFIFLGVNIGIGTYYTSIDDPIRSAKITVYRSLIASVIGVLLLPLIFGDNGIWMTVIFAEFTTFVIGLWMIRRRPFGNAVMAKT